MEQEIQGATPSLEIVDEVKDLTDMSELLKNVEQANRFARMKVETHGSPKVKDKHQNRAKAKKARASRRSNRG